MFTAMHLVTANTFIPGVMHKSKHLTDHIHSEVARLLSVIDICVVVHVFVAVPEAFHSWKQA